MGFSKGFSSARGLCAGTLALGFAAAAAEPEAALHQFSIPPKPAADALVDLAIQADISIGGTTACIGFSRGLEGRFTVEDGLRRLLAGIPCHFDILDPRTVRMAADPAPAPVRTGAVTAPPAESAPEEIMVTATKRVAAADRLPAAISVVQGTQLADLGGVDTPDTVGWIAGMSMTNLGPGRDKFLLRGLSDGTFTGRTQSTVGTYLDELPVNFNAPDPDLRLTDIEAVEVVRGPQGALYGSGSLSGIYRIVTRKPDLENFGGALSVSNGWTQSAAGSRSTDGMLNVPLVEDRAALRVVAYGDIEGGYLGNTDLKQSDVDRTTRAGGRAALEVRLNEDWTVTAAGALQTLESADAQYAVSKLIRANRVSEANRNDFGQGSVTVTEAGEWGRFSSSTGYVHHSFTNQYDASAALSLFDDNNAADIGVYDETAQIDMLVEDLVAASPGGGPLQWLIGVYGAANVERGTDILRSRGTGRNALLRYEERRRDRLNEAAPYGELSYDFGDGWTAAAGARLFETGLRTTSEVVVPNSVRSRDFIRHGNYAGAAPKVSLQHDFGEGDMAYVLFSEGYRPGGFNAGGIAKPTYSQTVYSSDHLYNAETGTKIKLAGGAIEIRSAVFHEWWDDIQTDQYLPSGLSYTTNVGDATVIGWENDISIRPLPGLTITLNDLYDSAKLTKATEAFTAAITSGLPGIPDFSFGSAALYEVPLEGDLTMTFGAEARYVGRSRLTFQPGLSPVMGGYYTGRLSTGVKTTDWRVLATVDNPANTRGDTFSFGNPFSFGQVRQITPLRPRTASLTVSTNF